MAIAQGSCAPNFFCMFFLLNLCLGVRHKVTWRLAGGHGSCAFFVFYRFFIYLEGGEDMSNNDGGQ